MQGTMTSSPVHETYTDRVTMILRHVFDEKTDEDVKSIIEECTHREIRRALRGTTPTNNPRPTSIYRRILSVSFHPAEKIWDPSLYVTARDRSTGVYPLLPGTVLPPSRTIEEMLAALSSGDGSRPFKIDISRIAADHRLYELKRDVSPNGYVRKTPVFNVFHHSIRARKLHRLVYIFPRKGSETWDEMPIFDIYCNGVWVCNFECWVHNARTIRPDERFDEIGESQLVPTRNMYLLAAMMAQVPTDLEVGTYHSILFAMACITGMRYCTYKGAGLHMQTCEIRRTVTRMYNILPNFQLWDVPCFYCTRVGLEYYVWRWVRIYGFQTGTASLTNMLKTHATHVESYFSVDATQDEMFKGVERVSGCWGVIKGVYGFYKYEEETPILSLYKRLSFRRETSRAVSVAKSYYMHGLAMVPPKVE